MLARLNSKYVWWLCVTVLTLAGIALQYTGHTLHREPWGDDRRIYTKAIQDLQGLPSEEVLTGYPPGILWLGQGVFCQFYDPNCTTATDNREFEVITTMTLFSIAVNAITGVLLALIGVQLEGRLVGLLALIAWFALPSVYERTAVAMTEPWQAMFYALAAYGAVQVLGKQRPMFALLSILGGLGAILFKYSAFPALGFGVGAVLYNLWVYRSKLWFGVLIAQGLMIGGGALLILFGYGATGLFSQPHEASQFMSGGLLENFTLENITIIIETTSYQLSLNHWLLIGLIVSATLITLRTPERWRKIGLGLILSIWLAHLVLIIGYTIFWVGIIRYTTPVSSLAVLCVVFSLAILARWFTARIGRPTWRAGVFVLLCLLWLAIPTYQSVSWAYHRGMGDDTTKFIRWTETSLPTDGTLLVPPGYWVYFSSDVYDYAVPERTWIEGDLTQKPFQEWLDSYVLYGYLDEYTRSQLSQQPDGEDIMGRMLLLKKFSFQVPYSSPVSQPPVQLDLYRLRPMAYETDVHFGEEMQLIGYDLNTTEPAPAETLTLSLYWRALKLPTFDYNVFVHLVEAESLTVVAQSDGTPALPTRPPTSWNDPEEVLIGGAFNLTIPDTTPSGTYRLIMGVYNWQTGVRLTTNENLDYVVLQDITIP